MLVNTKEQSKFTLRVTEIWFKIEVFKIKIEFFIYLNILLNNNN